MIDVPLTPAVDPQTTPPRKWLRRVGALMAVTLFAVVAGTCGALIGQWMDRDPSPPQRASDDALEIGAVRDGDLPRINVAKVAEYVAPSVVTVSADIEDELLGPGGSIGTGLILTSDGEILTNAHVVEGATKIRIRLAGQTEPIAATLLATDVGNDLALLRVSGDGYQPATIADPDSVRIGDDVVAIGFALDLDGDPSVTLGIISALDRTIVSGDGALDGLIQTDAAISSGNSGGPLVNSLGEVVGINTAVARGDSSVAATNIGFAISMAEAIPIIESLRAKAGGVERSEGYMGVGVDDRRDGGQGAIVANVEPESPAEAAGIMEDDLVISINEVAVDGAAGVVAAVRDSEPGDRVKIVVLRAGNELKLTVTLADRPES